MTTSFRKKPKVLIADDDEDLLVLIKMQMKTKGFEVQISPNAVQIFHMIADDRPDIILLDIHMNGIDGGDICKELKSDKTTKNIPIVMFSANDNIEQIAGDCGADGCVAKPFNSVTVSQKLSEILSRQRD